MGSGPVPATLGWDIPKGVPGERTEEEEKVCPHRSPRGTHREVRASSSLRNRCVLISPLGALARRGEGACKKLGDEDAPHTYIQLEKQPQSRISQHHHWRNPLCVFDKSGPDPIHQEQNHMPCSQEAYTLERGTHSTQSTKVN